VGVLDPEDKPAAHSEQRLEIVQGHGEWNEELKPGRALAAADLIWRRLRYRFTYTASRQAPIEGRESLSQILRTPVIHMIGQQSYLAGGQAAVRAYEYYEPEVHAVARPVQLEIRRK
jgi:hypothetical protein